MESSSSSLCFVNQIKRGSLISQFLLQLLFWQVKYQLDSFFIVMEAFWNGVGCQILSILSPEMGTSLMANVLRASFLLFRAEIFTVETSK